MSAPKLSQFCQGDEILERKRSVRNPPSNRSKQQSKPKKSTSRNPTRKQEESLQWKGFEDDDHVIVWPPMVLVHNTRSHHDETGKGVAVRRPQLLSFFKHYDIKNVSNAYGPVGHSGVSLLNFDDSAAGYFQADCLHKQFLRQGRGKDEWETHQGNTPPVGERLLYGYMATEGDMELLNKNLKGKQMHKYEMKSYKMMVVDPSKDYEVRLRGMKAEIEREAKENVILRQKIRLQEIEMKTIRQRVVQEIEESNAIDYLEKYNMDYIKRLFDDLKNKAKGSAAGYAIRYTCHWVIALSCTYLSKLVISEN